MSAVHNPEAEVIADIEKFELEVRNIRRRVEHAAREADKKVLNKQIEDLKGRIEVLRSRLPK